jgi:hypothetical protein
VRRVVLHPSAFVAWFGANPPALRREFETGRLEIVVPPSFVVDALGALAEAGWSAAQLEKGGSELDRIGFRQMDPPIAELASWLGRGLPLSAAAYAALASWFDVPIAIGDQALRARLRNLPQEPA